jgi:hypothetical protein
MKNPLIAGAIAGLAAATIQSASAFILYLMFKLLEPPGGFAIWDISMSTLFFMATLPLGIIWGIIFSVIYSRISNCIPGKGVMKGVHFGLLIWVIKDIAAGSYTALIRMDVAWGIGLIVVGFFMWIVYGPLLWYLYEK